MVHRRYYSPFENDVIVEPRRIEPMPYRHENRSAEEECEQTKKITVPRKLRCRQFPQLPAIPPVSGFLAGIQLDDIIIIGIILLLLFEEQEERDMPLILGLGALLIFGFLDT